MKLNLRKLIPIVLGMLYIILPVKAVFAETLEEQLNNLVGPKEQYNTMLSPVYLRSNTTEESVSPQSGELSLSQTDYVLPGVHGLDLEIKRIYKSGTSNIQEMKVNYVDGVWVDYVYSDANTSSFYEDRYNLGIGMRFSFSAIEVKNNEDGSMHMFLHTEAGDVYRLKESIKDNKKIYLPENQTIKDVEVYDTNEYTNGQADGTSKYKMVGKDGKKTYFSDDGRILGIVDRYNNSIKFEYSTKNYTIDGTNRTKKLISSITDTVGRVVTIDYIEDYSYTVGPIENKQYTLDDSYTAVQNPNTTDSGDLKGKFQVVINLPGNKKLIYDKSAALVSGSKHVIRTRLQSVIDYDGKPKYHFWYDQPELGFTYTNGTTYSVFNRYENLLQIDYPKTNRIKRYTYEKHVRGLSDKGSMEYEKVFEQKELAKKDFDSSQTQFINKFITDVKDKITYKFNNEADGFGITDYKNYDNTYLKDTYRYTTEKYDMGGNLIKYTYNGLHELVKNESSGNNHKEEFITEYDEMKFPKKKEVISYNIENGQTVRKIENFRYDEYGNLTNYTGPLADRDENGYPKNNENTIVYSYAYDKYHTPTLKTWKQDKDTTCQIKYEVDGKGNITKEEKVLTSNPRNNIITDYQYDNHGNMVKKTVYSVENSYVTNFEYGTDEEGVDYKGAYLTREYSVLDGKEISRKFTYDINTGNKKTEKDANENKTVYEYDVLGRLVRVINPDTTEKSYAYLEYVNADKKIEYTDARQTKYSNTYDILGNLTSSKVFDNNQWKMLKEVEYDYRGNKTKEKDANGNSSRFEYDSAGQLAKKSTYENDAVFKSDIKLNYIIAYDANTALLLSITDEEGYTSKYYYNISNQLVKSETTPDKSTYYGTTHTYDYVGNKVSTTDHLNNKTSFEYDELGRLKKKTDAALKETTYTYNSLDKALTVGEPDNRTTSYVYDVLGRVSEERVALKGSNDYAYKKYTYDGAGNVTIAVQGDMRSGINTFASKTEYQYNNMSRVTDEYRAIDDSKKEHIKYTYNNNGNRTSQTEFINESESKYFKYDYDYDFSGRQIYEKGSLIDVDVTGNPVINSEYSTLLNRDLVGNVLKEKKYNGTSYDETNYTYNYKNKPLTKIEPFMADGTTKTTKFTYDRNGNIKSQLTTVDGVEIGSKYEYDGYGHVISKSDTAGNTARYLFDANGNLTKEVDQRYLSLDMDEAPGIEYEYDKLNRQTKVLTFDGTNRTVLSYREYDGRGNVTKEADASGYNAQNPAASYGILKEYDALNNIVKITSSETAKGNLQNGTNNFTKKFAYDGAGRLISEEDSIGALTKYEYFYNGKLKTKTNPDLLFSSYEYDLTGKNQVKATDRAGNTTTTWNNIFGKPFRIEYPDETYETFAYSFKGELKEARDKAGNNKYFEYDPSGNLILKKEYIKDGAYSLIVNTFNEANNLVTAETFQDKNGEITSAGNKVKYNYDKTGRIVKIEGPNGREVIREYDAKGNLTAVKTKVRNGYYDVKRYTYDLLSRVLSDSVLVEATDIDLSKVKNPVFDQEYGSRILASTTYSYYDNGQVNSKKDAKGNETTFIYDLDNHVLEKNDIGTGKQTYKYNLRGELIEQVNSLIVSTYYDYDKMGRLKHKKSPAADGTVSVNLYIYDTNGNLKKTILPNDYRMEFDNSFQTDEMKGTSYIYDSMNRRVSTISPEGDILEKIKYNALGKVEKVVDGLRLAENIDVSKGTTYLYDGLGRLTNKTDALGNGYKYEYNVLGNLIKETDPRNNPTEYRYDSDGTMVGTLYADKTKVEYTYDKLGRQTSIKDQRGFISYNSYNALGKVKTQTDAIGGKVELIYDLNGNALSQKDKRGNTSYYSYDSMNRITEKKTPLELDAAGNVIYATEGYIYDSEGNILRKSVSGTANPDSRREVYYSYYPNNLVNTVSDSNGASSTSSYDKNGNLTMLQTLRDEGKYNIEKYEYDNMNRMVKKISMVDEDSVPADMQANGARDIAFPGMILLISGFSYDILGNKKKELSPMAFTFAEGSAEREKYTVNYSYDALNRLESVSRKYGDKDVSVQYYYDAAGNKERVVNELENETTFTYDSMNRLLTQSDSYQNTYSYKYDEAGNKKEETNSKLQSITYTYDALNRLETVSDPDEVVITKNIYDANGNLTKVIDAKGYLSANNDNDRYGTKYTYDLANRLVKVTDPEIAASGNPDKFTFKYVYSQFGEKLNSTDALGNATLYEYDNAGRLAKVTTKPDEFVTYGYDKAGNKLYMVDGRGKITSYSYGAMNILKSVTDADDKTISYKYDLNGNIAEVIDRNGNTTKYSYDNRNLLTEKEVKETGDRISFAYDAAGNRASMKDESGETSYVYDKNNRLLEIYKNSSKELSYTYDTVGNIETVTDFKGFVTTYSYDKFNRMKTVTFLDNTTTYVYDKNGNRESVQYQGGVKESYTYDKNNRLLTLVNKKPDGGEISKYSYTYYDNGLQKTKTDIYGTTEYIYDAAGRVEKVTNPGKTTVYVYDKAGNRLSQNETYTSNQPTGTIDETTGVEIQYIIKKSEYVYTNTNKLLKLTEKMLDSKNTEVLQKTTSYFYDDNGNELKQNSSFIAPHSIKKRQSTKGSAQGDDADESISTLIERTSNTFDGFNRLKSIESVKDGVRTLVEYNYNGDDLRVRKSVKKSDDQYTEKVTIYLYDRQYVILETDGADAVQARFVKGVNYIARMDATQNISYFLYNGHGDVVQTVTATGEVQNQYDYDIWGNPTLTVESYDCGIRYAGEYLDSESGLYYLRARYYNSYTGRFISEDSYWGEDSNPLSLNRYTYGHNNPIRFVDPSGHIVTEWDKDNLTNDQLEIVDKATQDWIAANEIGDEDGMAKASQAAEDARKTARDSDEIGSDSGYTYIQTDSGTSLYEDDKDQIIESGRGYNTSYYSPTVPDTDDNSIIEDNSAEPSSIIDNVNLIIGGKKIDNTIILDGKTYANIEEVAKAIDPNAKVDWDNRILSIKNTTISLKDDSGNPIGVRDIARAAGVDDTISWYHDRNGGMNVIIQPEMKNAPVKVIQEENLVKIDAYVNFTGDAYNYVLGTGVTTPYGTFGQQTYADLAKSGIEGAWSGGNYSFSGQNITVNTTVHTSSTNEQQKFLNVDIDTTERHVMTSHVELNYAGIANNDEFNSFYWSVENSSPNIKLYTTTESSSATELLNGNGFMGADWFKTTAAHEFGHAFGLGDAYNASYRGGTSIIKQDGFFAPSWYVYSDNGYKGIAEVPKDDIMLEGETISKASSNDIRMVLNAFRTNSIQYFPRSQSKDIDNR